jgi:hypothetical protein
MRLTYLLPFILLFSVFCAVAQTKPLTAAQCRILALENSPLQQTKLYAGSLREQQFRNIYSNSLPRTQVGAQASWQSDVILVAAQKDLESRLKQAEAAVNEGIALRTTRGLQISKEALELRAKPRIEAFAQGGLGRPNPFNFFETGFKPFVLIGVRAAWTPIDWGNKSRESQIYDLQMKNLAAQRQFFDQRLEANLLSLITKSVPPVCTKSVPLGKSKLGNAIIVLQEDIVRRAEAQVKNGVMTVTDYLTQL